MKKAKFWLSQIVMVAILSLVLGSPALAGKPTGNGGDCSVKKIKGVCPDDTSGDTSDGGSGYTSGDQVGTTDGDCPDGMVWLDLYNMCIPIS